jgi:SPW repeat
MADLRRARTPEEVRDRTADPPQGRTQMAEPSAGAESRTQVDDRGAAYAQPRHAREAPRDREMAASYGQERAPMGGAGIGSMLASAPSAVALLGGIWLLVSRLVFNYAAAGSAADGVLNGVVVGIAVALIALALMSSARSNPVLGLVLAVLGGWMIASPWIFNYNSWGSESGPTYSDVITGAGIAASGIATWLAGTARQVMAVRRRRPGMAM